MEACEVNNPDLIDEARRAFLEVWENRYPSPGTKGLHGLIVFETDKVYLEKNGNQRIQLLEFKSALFLGADFEKYQPSIVLLSGDWVECVGSWVDTRYIIAKVILLSPNRGRFPRKSLVNSRIREWNYFLKTTRQFFENNGFDEIRTPTIVRCPGTEPFLEAFKTEFIAGSRREFLYLPTSPELHLKKSLCMGWEKVFEIRSCFRNGEVSLTHQPEFSMLEWYRAFATLMEIRSDLRGLVELLNPEFKNKKWVSLSMENLFDQYLGYSLRPNSTLEDLLALSCRHGIDVSSATDFDEVFYFLFLDKIEPQLKKYDCLFLHSYPPSQAALAKLTPEGWGDRFEFYINGLEIANAFNELNDPKIQRARAHADLEKKRRHGLGEIPLDEEFFNCLESGMPPSSGIALGLDRLFMGLYGIDCISELRLFPFE